VTTIPTPAAPVTAPARPDVPVPRRLARAAALGGLGCALAVPAERPGIGWLVAGVVLAAAVALVGLRTPGGVRALLPGAPRLETAAWAVAALALAAVAWLRAAEWLVTLCLLAAFGAGTLAVAGQQVAGVVRAVLAVPVGVLHAVPWLRRAVARAYRTGSAGPDLRLVLSVAVGAVLLAVFGTLLASADAVFAGLVEGVLPALDDDALLVSVVLFGLGAAVVVGTAHLLVAPPPALAVGLRPTRLRLLDWAVPVGLLVALFALFVGVQLATLFGSDDYVRATTGLTFAEYARSGFWQLLAVSALALGVIVAGIRWAPAVSGADRSAKRLLLGALAVLCLVVVASALRRMWLYQQAYGFTVLRLLVGTVELWLGLAFLLALLAVLRLRPTGLARPMAGTAVAALLVLAALDPERFVAEQNVTRYAATGKIDTEYLSRLSADAVPALLALPDSPGRTCVLATIAAGDRPDPDEDWRSANRSRAAARAGVGHLAGSADRTGGDPLFGEPDRYGGYAPACAIS
jgi:uncharacterized protein DUF4153